MVKAQELIVKCLIEMVKNVYENSDKEELSFEFIEEKLAQEMNLDEKLIIQFFRNQNIINMGFGAGGSNTNYKGKKFEEKTSNMLRLSGKGYIKNSLSNSSNNKNNYYLTQETKHRKIIFVSQKGLKTYIKSNYGYDIFRYPDEAYIIENKDGTKIIKILEKKEQNVNGSVETKLWSGPSLKREYELVLGLDFKVFYGFCVNNFLKNKLNSNEQKYIILNKILRENGISILHGDDINYFESLDVWINNFL